MPIIIEIGDVKKGEGIKQYYVPDTFFTHYTKDKGEGIDWTEAVAGCDEGFEGEVITKLAVRKIIATANLTPQELEVIEQFYFRGENNFSQIAKSMRLSRQRIAQVHKKSAGKTPQCSGKVGINTRLGEKDYLKTISKPHMLHLKVPSEVRDKTTLSRLHTKERTQKPVCRALVRFFDAHSTLNLSL